MIINKKFPLECAIPFNKGWVGYCPTEINGAFIIDVAGRVEKQEEYYSIFYDKTNECPVIRGDHNIIWRPEGKNPEKRSTYNYYIEDWQVPSGSKQGQYIVVAGRGFPANYYAKTKHEKEESHYLLVAGDGTSKLLRLDLPIEGASISQDTQTILAFGPKGFIILDNPLI